MFVGILFEYIDEAFPDGHRLLPSDPYERAHVRLLFDEISKEFVGKFYASLSSNYYDLPDKDEKKEQFIEVIKTLTDKMDPTGPFFLGPQISMVDIAMFSHAFQQEKVVANLYDFELPSTGFERYRKWFDAILDLEAVQQTLPDPQRLTNKYREYMEEMRPKATK